MKPLYCIALNMLGAGICIGAGALAVDAGHVTALAGWLMAAGCVLALAGVVCLVIVEPEVWP